MIQIRFLGNACIEILGEKDHLLLDPTYVVDPKEGIKQVFITHEHADHYAEEKLSIIEGEFAVSAEKLKIYAPQSVKSSDIETTLVSAGDEIPLENGRVQVFSIDCWKAEACLAYLIELDGKIILHTADSAKFSKALETIPVPDICFIACFKDNFDDYLRFLKIIRPRLAVPYHFTEKNQENAQELVKELTKFGIPANYHPIGSSFEL